MVTTAGYGWPLGPPHPRTNSFSFILSQPLQQVAMAPAPSDTPREGCMAPQLGVALGYPQLLGHSAPVGGEWQLCVYHFPSPAEQRPPMGEAELVLPCP